MFQQIFQLLLVLLIFLTATVYGVFLFALFRGLGRLRKGNSIRNPLPSACILLCARNEEADIAACVGDLLAQDYAGEWNIWIADDRSTDSTPEILDELEKKHPERIHVLHISSLPEGISPKKYALARLVEVCRGEILLLTDADCRIPPTWASAMVREFEPGIKLVAGHSYIPTEKTGTPLILHLQALEAMSYRVVGTAGLAIGLPLTSTGNNLAYRRDFFLSVNGFSGVDHLLSGDDDLLLHRLAAEAPWAARPCTTPESFIATQGQTTWKSLWEQRKRWASPTVYYSPRTVAILASAFLFYFLLLLGGALGLVLGLPHVLEAVAVGFVLKFALDLLVMVRGLRVFNSPHLLKWFVPAELLHVPAIVFAVLFGVFGRIRWKN